jgi:hypothetical protein
MQQKDEPAKKYTEFIRYRVPQRIYEALGKPVEQPPSDIFLFHQDELDIVGDQPAARGGKVVCKMCEGQLTGIGVAVCSFSDVFDRKKGYDLAAVRASLALSQLLQLDLSESSNLRWEMTIEPARHN